jgi:heat-inducible transcriptional repressor
MQARLEERKARVLRAVVQDYIRTAEPVGSGTIVRRYRLGVSPATVRNEMASLEDLGYLVQPHTSAGRIPTDSGYRFYVDALPTRITLSEANRQAISEFFGEMPPDVDSLLQETASLLSRITGYAALAGCPVASESRVLRSELVLMGTALLLLVVTDTGRVDKRVIAVDEVPDANVVQRVSEVIADGLAGLSYEEAAVRAEALTEGGRSKDRSLLGDVAWALRRLRVEADAEHLHTGGVANIADERSFRRMETLRSMMQALEERATAIRLLQPRPGDTGEVAVRIGRENPLRAMREASVVVARYRAGGRPLGAIAIVGPTRMEYGTAISSARVVARRLSDLLGGLAG